MDVGIGLPNTVPDAEGSLFTEWSRRAEERGFSTLSTIGRVAYPGLDELTALAAAAAVTSRIGLLTNVLLAPTRNFVLLAREAATVDRLSGGRLTLGLAVGARPDDYAVTEQDMSTRGRRFDAGLDVMHRAWRGERIGGSGKSVSPRPTANDRVPIVFGGSLDVNLRRILEWGEGWTAGGVPAEMVAAPATAVRDAWTAAGKEGRPRLFALTYFSLGPHSEEASRRNLHDYYDFIPGFVDAIVDGAARSEDEVRARVAAFERAGVDTLVFTPSVARLDQVDRLADALFS
jgi:alkanesulfonate monooxygenase SsuD/methylene tetrahydromethanopterin reductase-like flavin-dependent oxidoreductase (luciferase family)